MSAHAHAKQPENTKSPQVEPGIQQAGPASNMEALGMLGMANVAKAAEMLTGIGPRDVAEEVLAMVHNAPRMVSVILDALPLTELGKLPATVLEQAPVVEWLSVQSPKVVQAIPGALRLVVDRMIPIGSTLELQVGAVLGDGKLTSGGGELTATATRTDESTWDYSLECDCLVQEGVDEQVGKKLSQTMSASASVTSGLAGVFGLQATWRDAPPLEQVFSGLSLESTKTSMVQHLHNQVLRGTPQEMRMFARAEGKVEGAASLTTLAADLPGLAAQVAEIGPKLLGSISTGAELLMTEESSILSVDLKADALGGLGLERVLAELLQLQKVLMTEENVTAVARIDLEHAEFLDVTLTHAQEQGTTTQVFGSLSELESAFAFGEGEVNLGERLDRMRGNALSLAIERELPRSEWAEFGVQHAGLDSGEILSSEVDLQIQQDVVYRGPFRDQVDGTTPVPANTPEAQILRALVDNALGKTSSLFQVDATGAASLLAFEAPRVVGTASTQVEKEGTLGEKGLVELSGLAKVSKEVDVPYTGPTKLL